jgi:hypothetical protein
MMIAGKLKKFNGLLTTSTRLYLDLSDVASGNTKILLLDDIPDQAPIKVLKGKLQTRFLKADGTPQDMNTDLPVSDTGKPVAATITPPAGGEIGIAEWKNAPYIDIAFAPGAEKKLNLTTITDADAEFQLIDPDGTSITIASTPTQPEGFEIENKFRFALPSGFEPKVGIYQVKFLTGTWSDTENTTNTAVTEKITVKAPKPTLAAPMAGGTIDRAALNTNRTLTVFFRTVGSTSVDEASILDSEPEFTLSGSAASGVTIGQPTKVAGTDFEYRYVLTGNFSTGEVTVDFIAGSYKDKKNNINIAEQSTFTVTGSTAQIVGPSQLFNELNERGYIELQFSPTLGGTLDESSLTDIDPEFTVSGSAASSVVFDSVPVKQESGAWRYAFTGTFTTGVVELVFDPDAFTDSNGNANVPTTLLLRVDGITATPLAPAHGATASLQALNSRKYFDVKFTPIAGSTVDSSTILDDAQEFTLSGTGKGTATITTVEQVSADTFRYNFTGEFKVGPVNLTFTANSFKDSSGKGNISTVRSWNLQSMTGTLVDPSPNTAIAETTINARHTIDVKLPSIFGSPLNTGSITDADAEVELVKKNSAGEWVLIPGVTIDGSATLVPDTTDTYRYSFSGMLPTEGAVYVRFVANSWTDQNENPSAESVESFRVFLNSDTFELTVAGSSELLLPFVTADEVVFGIYGSAVLRASSQRTTLDFSGHAKLLYLGKVAAAAGRIVISTPDGGPTEVWGVASLDTNFEKLQPYGIDADLKGTLQFNSSANSKSETITLKGMGPNGTDLTDTYELQPYLFRIEAGGKLDLHIPTFEPGPPAGKHLASLRGAFSIEVSSTRWAFLASPTRVWHWTLRWAWPSNFPAPSQSSSHSMLVVVSQSTQPGLRRKYQSQRISSNFSPRTSAVHFQHPPTTPPAKASSFQPALHNVTALRALLGPTSSHHSKENCCSLRSSSSAAISASKSAQTRFALISMHSSLSIPSAALLLMGP